MRNFVDLHTHSTASDGSCPPAEIVAMAERRRLAAVALTDHDTIDGLAAARAAAEQFPKLAFVNGIEVSARFPQGTLHILGLAIDPASVPLVGLCRDMKAARDDRNPRIVRKLQELGFDIGMDDVLAVAAEGLPGDDARSLRDGRGRKIVGRLHIAEAMRRKGYVSNLQQAFNRYIGAGGPAYIDKERLEPAEVIAAIRRSGGVAVLAHPVQLRCDNFAQLERIIRGLIRDGLEGIEVYHSDHSPEQTRAYLNLARKFDLASTGGSDYHGPSKPDVSLGRPRVPIGTFSQKWAARLFGGALKRD